MIKNFFTAETGDKDDVAATRSSAAPTKAKEEREQSVSGAAKGESRVGCQLCRTFWTDKVVCYMEVRLGL